jgi:hypothetical protein
LEFDNLEKVVQATILLPLLGLACEVFHCYLVFLNMPFESDHGVAKT